MAIPFLDDYVGALQSQGNLFDTYKYLVEKGADALIPYGGQGIQAVADMFKNKPSVGDRENYVTPDNLAKFYAGEKYGYQSPESYKSVFGGFPRGFTPPVTRPSLNAPRTDNEQPFIAIGTAQNPGDPNTKYYTGENYGNQSPESYKQVLGVYPVGYTPKSSTSGGKTTDTGKGAGTSNIGQETGKPFIDLVALQREAIAAGRQEKQLGYERQRELAEFYDQSAQVKTRENTERQKQLAIIESWRALAAAKIEADLRGKALITSTMMALQVPNTNVMSALTDAFTAGAAPFANTAIRKRSV